MDYYYKWLEKGFQGSMTYMERNREKRLDPRLLLPGAQSVIVVAQNYFPGSMQMPEAQSHHTKKYDSEGRETKGIKIAKYAWGKDYHFVIKEKLAVLARLLEEMTPGTQCRVFTDSAPVLERAWAQKAGIGWTGKNACLIIPQKGSYFFLAEIITTMALEPDEPFVKNHCGNCTRCIKACPTGAIVAPGSIDARRCLSYLTIESKEIVPPALSTKSQGWVFGCDICQDVCPHNRFTKSHNEPGLKPLRPFREWTNEQWLSMTKTEFRNELAKAGSPLARVKYEKLAGQLSNAALLQKEHHTKNNFNEKK